MSVETTAPSVSVVVAIASDTVTGRPDTAYLARTLEALRQQIDPPPLEILVPHHRGLRGIEDLRRRFPEVRFLPVNLRGPTVASREHHDELRARGLQAARGEILALTEDHARPDPRWCARLLEAHRQTFAAVGGAIENEVDRPLNWAVYFCDFGRYQNPVSAGETAFASDVNVAYKRSALESVQQVWQESFCEPVVNAALAARGQKLALSPEIIVYQHRSGLRLAEALLERFIWGRSYGAARARLAGNARRLLYTLFSPALPALLLLRMAANVIRKGRCVGRFLTAFPLLVLLAVSWSCGELAGYVTGRPR